MEPKPFRITIPILKAYKDEDGNFYIRGLGGDAEPDYDPKVKRIERLSLECIKDFQRQVQMKDIPIIPRHYERGGAVITNKPEWDDELGRVVELIVNPYGQMFPLIKLDMDNSRAETLYRKIRRGSQLGLSWGGLPIAWHTEFDENGMEVRVFDKIELWHFAVTTKPVNGRTLNNPLKIVAKSIDWSDAEAVKTGNVTTEVEYPERQEVQAMFKSFRDSDTNDAGKPAKGDSTKTKKEDKRMTPEELKVIQDSMAAAIGVAVKAAIEPIQASVKAITDAADAADAAAKAAAAAKAGAPDISAIKGMIEETVKAAVKAAIPDNAGDTGGSDKDAAAKAKELQDMISDKINDALKNLSTGLKGKKGADGTPGDDEDSEVVKAMKELMDGAENKDGSLKTIDDFSKVIQRKLEDFSASAFKSIEAAMPKDVK